LRVLQRCSSVVDLVRAPLAPAVAKAVRIKARAHTQVAAAPLPVAAAPTPQMVDNPLAIRIRARVARAEPVRRNAGTRSMT